MVAVLCRVTFLTTLLVLFVSQHVNCQIKIVQDEWNKINNIANRKPELEVDRIPSDKEIAQGIKSLLSSVLATEDNKNISTRCHNDTMVFMNDWPDQVYARQMFTSFGDLPEIVREFPFTWNPKSVGSFGRCRAVKPDPGIRSFGGLYCKANIEFLIWGVCFPDSCTQDEVTYLLSQGAGLPARSSICIVDPPYTTGDYIAIVICSVLAALMITGSTYDVIYHRKLKRLEKEQAKTEKQQMMENKTTGKDLKKMKPGYLGQFFISFSVITNGRKLLSAKKGGSGSISALNGIRVISMFWVILGHSQQFAFGKYDNNRYIIQEVIPRFSYITVMAGIFAVDTFFLLSGCLVSYVAMKQLFKTNGRLNWLLFYFHRWWRLTPAFGLMMLIWTTLIRHIGNGPDYNQFENQAQLCRNYWWACLFYFNNLYPWPGVSEMCMGWVWYLQVDMQLFVLSPIFLICLYKSFRLGSSVAAFFTVASIGMVAGVATYFGKPMGFDTVYYNDNQVNPNIDILYGKPWSRLQVYTVGIFLGYVLCKIDGKRIKLNKVVNLLCWVLAIGMGLTLLYGLHPTQGQDGAHPDQWFAVLYTSISRFLYAVSVSWVIFACATGNGGPINTLLSWSGWIPLARLTYCAYLVHPMILLLYYWGLETCVHYTEITGAYIYMANIVISYMVAFIISLAVESPLIGLEKLMFRR